MNPPTTRASHGETAEEWLARAENVLRLTLSAAEHSTGVAKAILLRNADELNQRIHDNWDDNLITDATRTQIAHISSNYIRAQQAEGEGDDRAELRHLLFAAQDISKILEEWQNNQMDYAMAVSYADSLHHTTTRIKELIVKGVPKQ